MKSKYGELKQTQIWKTKDKMRKRIFFLLLIADPATAEEYDGVDVDEAIENVLVLFGGMNKLLNYPQEIVTILSLLTEAKEYWKTDFRKYRKLVLDAGNEVLKIKEV